MFLEYIADGTTTSYQFAKRFGLNAYKQYWVPYNTMIQEMNNGDKDLIEDLNKILKERENNDLPF